MQDHINPKLRVANLNRVQKRLTKDTSPWTGDAYLYLTVKAPHSPNGPHAGLNGSTPLTKFVSDTFQVRDFRLVRSSDSNYTTLYANIDVNFNDYDAYVHRDNCLLIQYRNLKGKRDSLRVSPRRIERFRDLLGYALDSKAKATITIMDNAASDFAQAIHNVNEERLHAPYVNLIQDAMRHNCRDAHAEIRRLFEAQGLKVLDFHVYNFEISFSCTSWIKDTENEFSIGYWSYGTYASHPVIVSLQRVSKPMKTVKLMDIGAEQSGYYSHDNRLEVTPDQVNAIKKHIKEFNEGETNEDTENQRKHG